MLDIPYIDAPEFVPPRGFEWHLFLWPVLAFRLSPPIERTMLRHDASTGARRYLYSLLEQGGVHTPFPNERVFLLFSDLIGNFKRDHPRCFACVRFVFQPPYSFLNPPLQRGIHRWA